MISKDIKHDTNPSPGTKDKDEKAENAIRPFVLGRKAWLFSTSTGGAEASAVIYSLVETAKANNIEPHRYLSKVIAALPNMDTLAQIETLLPWNIEIK